MYRKNLNILHLDPALTKKACDISDMLKKQH